VVEGDVEGHGTGGASEETGSGTPTQVLDHPGRRSPKPPERILSAYALRLRGMPIPGRPGPQPTLKLALTWKTALTIAKAMNPTKMKTPARTPLAITFVNRLSCLEISFW
jgi:hypothetical protein